MKTKILLLIFMISTFQLWSQDYCLNNAQKAYNVADNYGEDAYEILEQPDGRFVIMGTSYVNGPNSYHITGIRVFPNGNLDPTFGNQGKIDFVFEQRNTAICAALQNDGKILVGGYQAPGNGLSSFKPYVARINSDGTLDTDFGNNGSSLVPHSTTNDGVTVALKVFDDGKIQVISNHLGVGGSVARLLSNGDPDSTFNGIGYTSSYQVSGSSVLYDNPSSYIAEDSTSFYTGNVPVGDNGNLVIAKYNPDGTLSEDFGEDGKVTISDMQVYFNRSIRTTMGYDGNLLISFSNSDNLPAIVKLNSTTGDIMTSFGDNGFVVGPISTLNGEIFDLIPNESEQDWVVVLDGTSDALALMHMDDQGTFIPTCGSLYFPVDLNYLYTQNFSCGLFDSTGKLRLTGITAVADEDGSENQTMNYMWPYYEPPAPDPVLFSVSPNELVLNEPVELNINGFGMNDVQEIFLKSSADSLYQSSFDIINNEVVLAVFNPLGISEGIKDLVVYTNSDTLILEQAITVGNDNVIGGDVNMLSRKRILFNGPTLYSASYANLGSTSMLATPLIVINEAPYTVDFSDQSSYDLLEDPSMSDLLTYLGSQGIETGIVNESEFEDEGNSHHAFLASNLAPQSTKYIGGICTITELTTTPSFIYLHPNPMVSSDGLLDTYTPQPGFCTPEIVFSALFETIPSVDVDDYNACFENTYTQNQMDLANIARELNDERVIPFKGAMMKLLFDLMTCIDNTYELNESEFELFNAKMALLFATDVILDSEFPCESYVEASTYYHSLMEESEDRMADPWGIGINFNTCYGCKTMNDIEGVGSVDPNEKIGPSQQYGGTFINNKEMFYAIHFENLDSADVAAKTVRIVDSLDIDQLDINTFEFTAASWGEKVVTLSPQADVMDIDLRPEVPNILRITTELDEINGVVTWLFQTLDTLSMMPTEDVDQGFLPPNVNAPEGMGFVSFEMQLKENIESGSVIQNDAAIYFDFNDPIITNTWTNTFDNEIPESNVLEIVDYVPGEMEATIEWETSNDDPNILYYNIYYNTDNGEEWIPWQVQTTETSAVFGGDFGTTYYFISVAVDSAFNVEDFPMGYDAMLMMSPVSVAELDNDNKFMIYPNPANEQVTLVTNNSDVAAYAIKDITGRIVNANSLNKGAGQHVISISSYPIGMYLVEWYDVKNMRLGQSVLVVE